MSGVKLCMHNLTNQNSYIDWDWYRCIITYNIVSYITSTIINIYDIILNLSIISIKYKLRWWNEWTFN